jgi:hypothetical protein
MKTIYCRRGDRVIAAARTFSFMQSIVHLGKYAAAALLGLLAWNYAAYMFINHTVNSPSARAEGEFYKMQREAQAKYKTLPPAEATKRYASEKMSKELAAITSVDERAFKAAQIFMGFYWVNARARAEFCEKEGIDISSFVTEFSRRHRPQYNRAMSLFQAHGLNAEATWSTLRASLTHAVEQDMWPLGGYGKSMAEACEEIAKGPVTFASKLDLTTHQPILQHALMGP